MRAAALAAVLALLAGCAAPSTSTGCPPLVEYSPDFTEQFRQQLKTIPAGSPVAIFILDQIELRDQVRECQ